MKQAIGTLENMNVMFSGSSMDPLRFLLWKARLQRKVRTLGFTLSARWETLGDTETEDQEITVPQDFLCTHLLLTSHTAVGTIVANPDYRFKIADGRNDALMDDLIHVGLLTGENRNAGARPFELPYSWLFEEATKITVTMFNRTTTASVVELGLLGVRIDYRGSDRQAIFG